MIEKAIQEFLNDINRRLDPNAVLAFLTQQTVEPQVVAGSLKCYCPVHQETAFRTLYVDINSNTCQCITKDCKAHRQLTLIQLVALTKGILEIEAAWVLIRQFAIRISPEMRAACVRALIENGNRFLQENRPKDAIRYMEAAFKLNPENYSLAVKLSKVQEDNSYPKRALTTWRVFASIVEDQVEKERILRDEILRLAPDNREALMDLADLIDQTRRGDQEVISLRRSIGQSFFEEKRYHEAIQQYLRIRDTCTQDPDFLCEISQLYEKIDSQEEAAQSLREAAHLYEDNGQDELALRCVESIIALDPLDFQMREKQLELRERVGDIEGYLSQLSELAEESLQNGEKAKALGYLESLARRKTNDITTWKQIIELASAMGDSDREVEATFSLAEYTIGIQNLVEAERLLYGIDTRLALNTEQYIALAGLYEQMGRHQDHDDVLFELGKRTLGSNPDDALKWLFPILKKPKGEAERLYEAYEAIRPFKQHVNVARRFLFAAVDDWAAQGKLEIALDNLSKAFFYGVVDQTPEAHRKKARLLLRLGNHSEAFEELLLGLRMTLQSNREAEIDTDLDELKVICHESWAGYKKVVDLLVDLSRKDTAINLVLGYIESLPREEAESGLRACERLLILDQTNVDVLKKKAAFCHLLGRVQEAIYLYNYLLRHFLENDEPEEAAALVKLTESMNLHSYEIDSLAVMNAIGKVPSSELVEKVTRLFTEINDRPASQLLELARRIAKEEELAQKFRIEIAEALHNAGHSDEALHHFNLAAEELRDDSPQEVVRARQQIVEISPYSSGDWLKLSDALRNAGDRHGAQRTLLHAFDIAVSTIQSSNDLSLIYNSFIERDPTFRGLTRRYLDELRDRGDTREASRIARDYVSSFDGDSTHGSESFDALIIAYDLNPEDRSIAIKLALAHFRSGNQEVASKLAAKILHESVSDGDRVSENLALLCLIDIYQDDYRLYKRLSRNCEEDGNLREAARILELYVNRAESRGEHKNTVECLEQILTLTPDKLDARRRLIVALEAEGHHDNASEHRLILAEQLLATGDIQGTLAVWEEIDVSDRMTQRGQQFHLEFSLKRHDWKDAINVAPKCLRLLIKDRETDEAQRLYEEILEILPESELADEFIKSVPFCMERSRKALERLYVSMAEKNDDALPDVAVILSHRCKLEFDVDRAREVLASTMSLYPSNLTLCEHYLRLLEENESDESEAITLRKQIVTLHSESGNYSKANEFLAPLLKNQQTDVETLILAARIAEQSGQLDDALILYRQAADHPASDPKIQKTLAVKIHSLAPEDTEIGRRLYDQSSGKERKALLLKLVEAYRQQEQWEEIEELLSDGQSQPEDLELLEIQLQSVLVLQKPGKVTEIAHQLVHDYRAGNRLDDAIRILESVVADNYGNDAIYRELGNLHLEAKNKPQAVVCYLYAARILHLKGLFEESLTETEKVLTLDPRNEEAFRTRSQVFQAQGLVDLAVKELLKIAGLLAREQKIELYREILRLDESHLEVREQLAEMLTQSDSLILATEQYLKLSEEYEKKGTDESALEAAHKALALDDSQFLPHIRVHLLAKRLGLEEQLAKTSLWLMNHHEGQSEFEPALRYLYDHPQYNESTYFTIHAARLKKAIGKKDEAQDLLRRAEERARASGHTEDEKHILESRLEMNPTDQDALQKLSKLCLRDDSIKDAVDWYFKSFSQHMENVDIEKAEDVYTEILSFNHDDTQIVKRGLEVFREHDMPELAAREQIRLARLYIQRGEFTKASEELDPNVSFDYFADEVADLRVSILQLDGKLDEAIELLSSQFEECARTTRVERAFELCHRLVQLDEKNIDHRLQLANYYGKLNKRDEQIKVLRDAADLYMQSADYESAVLTLRQLLSIVPDDTRARIYYIDSYRQVGEERDLIEDYVKLANAHQKNGALQEARSILEKANHLAPDNPDVLHAYINFLFQADQKQEATSQLYRLATVYTDADLPNLALKLLEDYDSKLSKNATFYMAKGDALLKNRARGMAAQEYRKALAIYKQEKAINQEIQVLRKLLAIDKFDVDRLRRLIHLLLDRNERVEAVERILTLAEIYTERELFDLAVEEYHRVLHYEPERRDIWMKLFDAYQKLNTPERLLEQYIQYGDYLTKIGAHHDAVDYFQKALEIDSQNLTARKGFIKTYPKIGNLGDIVDDVIELGQAIIDQGEVEEGLSYFELAMSVDPQNEKAQEMMSATQSGDGTDHVDLEDLDNCDTGETLHGLQPTQSRVFRKGMSPIDFLEGTLSDIDKKENEETLDQVVANYRDIISVNKNNPKVRVKLAEVLERMGRIPEVLEELGLAVEDFYNQDLLAECVDACERFLSIRPQDQRIRKRLNEAVLKKDALRMLNSSILYSEEREKGERY